MKLVELHIADRRTRAPRHRNAIARRHGGIRRIAVNLSRAAGGQQHRTLLHYARLTLRIFQHDTADAARICAQQVDRRDKLTHFNAWIGCHHSQQRTGNLPTCGVAMGMQNARSRVRPFARPHQIALFAIELGAPCQQLFHARRSLLHQHLSGLAVHQAVACHHRVVQMLGDVLGTAHGHGDAALRIGRVRLGHLLLRHHQHAASLCQRHCCPKPGDSSAHHNKIKTFRGTHPHRVRF